MAKGTSGLHDLAQLSIESLVAGMTSNASVKSSPCDGSLNPPTCHGSVIKAVLNFGIVDEIGSNFQQGVISGAYG
jgi:hypothetical protein